MILFVALAGTSGCGRVVTPVVKLNAAFKNTYVFIPKLGGDLPMTLLLRNDGNQKIEVLKADGGCSCRTVDQSPLPATLLPGGQFALSVRMTAPTSTSPQSARFDFETNHGLLAVSIPYFSLVNHQFNPDAASHTALSGSESWTFDFTHRAIYQGDGPKPTDEPVFPQEFVAERTGTRGGVVSGAPVYSYEDVSYRLTLREPGLGLRKAIIYLPGSDKRPVLEAPIVWERLPFLSSVPKQVALGARPVRVFLRCRDDSVELTRVLNQPRGIKAVVDSPREIRVALAADAPAVIDVETTAQGKSALRIRVVRYSSRAEIGNAESPQPRPAGE